MADDSSALSRKQQVIQAAYPVFMRLGLSRTTMQDIAKAAGLSRPALYLLFANKEDIAHAVILWFTQETAEHIRTAAPGLPTLSERLHLLFHEWFIVGFQVTQTHPEVADLFRLSLPAMQHNLQEFQNLLTELVPDLPAPVARVVGLALHGFKEAARDEEAFKHLMQAQLELVMGYVASLHASGKSPR